MHQKDYRGFFNPVNNSDTILTKEDIGSMSKHNFAIHEKAIDFQLQNIGIPSNAELENSSGVVHVHAYDRSTGHVREHYRSLPHRDSVNPQIPNVHPLRKKYEDIGVIIASSSKYVFKGKIPNQFWTQVSSLGKELGDMLFDKQYPGQDWEWFKRYGRKDPMPSKDYPSGY